MARSHLTLLLLCVGALLAHPIPSGDTALSAPSSELSQDAVSFLQEEGEDDAVLADGESGGNGKKVLKKKIKALEKRTDARRRRMANQHAKKKIKKKIKATEKVTDAKERKDHAAEKKAEHEEGDDGAVSFLQYEAATPAVLQPHEASVLFKKLLTKASEDDEDDPDDPDVCDKDVQKGFFDMIDADGSGEITKEELIDFAKEMCMEDEGEEAPTEEECQQEAEHFYGMMDTNDDGEVSLDEFETFLDNMGGCNGKASTSLKAHTGGNGKKKLNKNEASVLFKKLLTKASEDDEDDPDDPDVCDKDVQKGFFDMIDADGSGKISKEELIDFAEAECEEEGEPKEDCAQDAEGIYDDLDTNGDGEVSLDEFETFLDNMFECNGKARTNLKAHTGGNGKKKLKKKLKAMEKKAEARRKQTVNQHAKKVIKKKIKASEKVAEAKERAHAAAARKAAKEQEDGDDDGKAM